MEKTNLKKTFIHYGILSVIPFFIMVMGIILEPGMEIGYTLLSFYFVIPLTALISGMVFTRKDIKPFWLHPIVFAAYMIIILFVLSCNIDIFLILIGVIPSIFGVTIGIFLKKLSAKKS